MKKKTDQQKTELMRKKAVAVAKIISKIRDGYKCVYCGKGKDQVAIHSHHIYNEGCHKSMSADVDNLITACFTHHCSDWNSNQPSFHKNPQEMADFMNEKYPEKMKELKLRSQKSIHCDIIFWTKKLAELKEELAILDGVDN